MMLRHCSTHSPLCLRCGNLLEELLVAQAGAGAGDVRAQPAGELRGKRTAGVRLEVYPAREVRTHQGDLVFADSGGVERARVVARTRDVRRLRRIAAVADHERARGVITEPLVVVAD